MTTAPARTPPAAPTAPPPLPPLRQDIELHAGARTPDGAPTWVLVDPASGTYFHIGWAEFEILSRWPLASGDAIAAAVNRETALRIAPQQVEGVQKFFEGHGLLRPTAAGLAAKLAQAQRRRDRIGFATLLQRILYTRIPLLDPRALLARIAPSLSLFFTRGFWLALGVVLLLALYLLGRQWAAFAAGLTSATSLEAAAAIAVTLLVAKLAHEMGHAVAATRYGAEVPVVGVALILGCPLLYTETTAAWIVRDRRQRIVIALAGVAAESFLAVLALLVWSLLDPGALRDAAAFAVTTLLVLTFLINANPLMRFDGYFVLAEVLGVDNLQPRALARVGWRLRRLFGGVREPEPDPQWPARLRALVEAYGFAALAYRAVIFAGIAYALDRMLFAALALPLAAAVIALFVAKPLFGQIRELARSAMRTRDRWALARGAAVLALLAAVLLAPWRTTVSVPVIFEAGATYDIFAPEPARLVSADAYRGQRVRKGDVILRLGSPDLASHLARAALKVRTLELLIDQHATGAQTRDAHLVHQQELAKATAEHTGFERRLAQLDLHAPVDGVLTFVEPGLWPGVPVASDRPLAQLVAAGGPRVIGYVDERDLASVSPAAPGVLWLDGLPDASYPVRVETIFREANRVLDHPLLAVPYGGPIAARAGPDRRLTPDGGVYKVVLSLAGLPPAELPRIRTRGFARIDMAPRNLVSRLWLRLVGLWRRELG